MKRAAAPRLTLGSLALLSVVSFCSSSSADAPPDTGNEDATDAASERAETLAARARDEAARGEAQKAIDSYNEAYAASPAAVILFNIAVVHEQARHVDEAVLFYRRAIAAGDLDPTLVTRATERIAALEKPARVMKPTPVPPTPAGDDGWHRLRVAGVVVAGAGVVALGVTGVLAVVAKSKDSDADSFCDGDRCTNARALELTDDARGLATAATVTFVSGAVLVASGVVLWMVAPRTPSTSPPSASSALGRGLGLGCFTW